jgi:hypothetical protein
MARFKLGETVTARPNGGEPITGKITFIREESYNPGGGLPDVKKEYYTIVGGGHKTKVREYEIITD